MSTKHDLKHSILNILKHNKDGSFATQANRKTQLIKLANDLLTEGFYLRNIHQLKAKHVYRLIAAWKSTGLSAGTLKNRLANIRWLCEKMNKPGLIPANNNKLNIERRQYVTNQDKSIALDHDKWKKITDPDVKMSLRLQKAFGLRKEESIKIKIHEAVQGDQLVLRGVWCKNGRKRILPICTAEQKTVIAACKAHVGKVNRALIPDNKSYYQQMKKYENELAKVGLNKAHGLRHTYAQQRYFELTGWHCPAKQGPSWKQLTAQQKAIDQTARENLTRQLGHNRVSVLSIYIGR